MDEKTIQRIKKAASAGRAGRRRRENDSAKETCKAA